MLYIKKYFLIIIVTIIILLNIIPTPYYAVAPGEAINLSQNIIVENGEKDARGKFLLTSTILLPANLWLCIYSFFDPNIELESKGDKIPEEMDQEEYMDIMTRMMEESQLISKIVALKKAGYNPELTGKGVIVNKILDNSPAKGKLAPGDVIIRVNDQPVFTLEEFSKSVQDLETNQFIEITFLRNNFPYNITVPLIKLQDNNYTVEKLGIGIYATTKDLQCKFPLNVEINLNKVKGPSAGLMIALEILNQLTENDFSSGLVIAGTGNLGIDGKITKVDGIKQKIISAKKQKADVFIVPKENYSEAIRYSKDIKVVPVENFDETIMKLTKL